MKKLQNGRSMIEMLGVLAIVGILSVGAIAGYQKAMMKYKLNKQTQQIGSILDNAHIHLDSFRKSKADISHNMIPLMMKMGLIPTEMIKPNDTQAIYDIFGNIIRIYNYVNKQNYYFEFIVELGKNNMPTCQNLFQIAKQRSSLLYRTKFEFSQSGTVSPDNEVYGDKYCSDYVEKCLKDFPLTDAQEFCTVCEDKDSCLFYFQLIL